jgi:hypothetical protein
MVHNENGREHEHGEHRHHEHKHDEEHRHADHEPGGENPVAPRTHRDSPYTHDGGQVGGGIGATHDGGVVGGAGRAGDREGTTPPDAHELGAGVDYSTGHNHHDDSAVPPQA